MRKSFMSLVICIILLITSACSSTSSISENSLIEDISFIRIPLSEIFSKPFSSYYILVYSSTCMACISTLEVLEYKIKYQYFDLFLVDCHEVIKRNECNIGVSNSFDLSYKSVPLLLIVENKTIKKEIYGFENIREYFTI